MSDAPAAGTPILATDGLAKSFRDGERELHILQGVDLQVAPGETVAILGRSGSGKSTLLHILGLLDGPTAGTVRFDGADTGSLSDPKRRRIRAERIGFVFQHFHLLPELTARDNVLLAARVAGHGRKGRDRADALLEAVGLAERTRHRPRKLSGGEAQRVAIARALVNRPDVLLCDEPTGNLDRETAAGILDLLFDVAQEHARAMVVVTHDEEIARRADRRLRLQDGRLATE